jgi:hypothetical protein
VRLDRSIWLIGAIVVAAAGLTASMVLYATVSYNSAWEWDISIVLSILGFGGVALGVLVIMGWGRFGKVRVSNAGGVGKGESDLGRSSGEGTTRCGDAERLAGEGRNPA